MNVQRARAFLLTSASCFAVCIGAQTQSTQRTDTAPPPSPRFPANWYPSTGLPGYTLDIEKGVPYTATLVTRGRAFNPRTHQYKTLTNNTLQARDSAGRRHEEVDMPRPDGHGGSVDAHEVTVHDPVSHCDFQWMQPWAAPGKPTATVTCMPRVLHYRAQNIWAAALVSAPTDKVEGNTIFHSEPLGSKLFGNIPAEGVRQTKTIVNASTGQRSSVVTEIWYSPELRELISMKMDFDPPEPVNSFADFELTDIHRGEPDPSLFYPPKGYAIESERRP